MPNAQNTTPESTKNAQVNKENAQSSVVQDYGTEKPTAEKPQVLKEPQDNVSHSNLTWLHQKKYLIIAIISLLLLITITAFVYHLYKVKRHFNSFSVTGSRSPAMTTPTISPSPVPASNLPATSTSATIPTPSPTPAPTPAPTPIPIKHGQETYSISMGKKDVPQMTQVVFEPLDPKPNQTQTISVTANHTQPIKTIEAQLKTDNKSQTQTLELTSGSETDGVWQTSWVIDDTYLYNYVLTLTANGNQSSTIDITIR